MMGGSKLNMMSRRGHCYTSFLLSVQDVGGHWRDGKMVGEIKM